MMKTCTKCGKEKTLQDFNRRSSAPDGLTTWCKKCDAEYGRQYRASEHGKSVRRAYVESESGKADIQRHRTSEKCKATRKEYYASEEVKRAQAEWFASEAGKASVKKYKASSKGKAAHHKYQTSDKSKARIRRYQNSEKGRKKAAEYRATDKAIASRRKYRKTEKLKAGKRAYNISERGRETRRARNQRRKALKLGATVGQVDEQRVFEACGNRCVYCGSTEKLTLDHVIALSKGGAHAESNLVAACLSCNCSKGARPVAEWLATRPMSMSEQSVNQLTNERHTKC